MPQHKIRTTKTVKLDTIQPHPDNYNHGDAGAISLSLQHHGQYRAIVVSEATGNILAGNHTYLAAQMNGETKMLAHLIPELSAEDEIRIMVADNQYARLAYTDDNLLSELLLGLQATDVGLTATGWDGDDLDRMLAELVGDTAGRDGDVVELPVVPVTQLGDVWQLGPHTLTCGDAFDVTLEGDTIITDPPYGMRLDTDYSGMVTHDGSRGKTYRPVIGDDADFDPSPLFNTYLHIKDQMWFGADYYRRHLPDGGSWYVWDKRHTGNDDTTKGADRLYGSHFELVWSKEKRRREILRFLWAGAVGGPGDSPRNRKHPTQKPIPLMEHLIGLTDGTVLDPFAGSGSTLIAADNLNRTCHAVELDPAYCDVIVKRWETLTGDTATLMDKATP